MGADRYWRMLTANQPGYAVAVHDGYQGLPGAGPGKYRVEVVRPGRFDPAGNAGTIILQTAEGTDLCVLNRGAARWFGLRLIEAAAIDELREANLAGMQVNARWGQVQEWMDANAADYLVDVPAGDSIVPAVLRLLSDAKQILADNNSDSVRP